MVRGIEEKGGKDKKRLTNENKSERERGKDGKEEEGMNKTEDEQGEKKERWSTSNSAQ